MEKLSENEIQAALADVPEWGEVGGEIQRTFQFSDFKQAMEFVNKVAEAAESAQHHPDILIRYNKVTLTISTHDVGKKKKKDFDFAKAADGFIVG